MMLSGGYLKLSKGLSEVIRGGYLKLSASLYDVIKGLSEMVRDLSEVTKGCLKFIGDASFGVLCESKTHLFQCRI